MSHHRATKTKTIRHKNIATLFRAPLSQGLANPILHLHQTLGNQAVGRFIQAKLEISQPGDVYEQEANRMADQVMATRTRVSPEKFATTGKQETPHQSLAATTTPLLQPQSAGETSAISDSLSSRIQSNQSGGQLLPPSTRQFMELRFGSDFSGVRLHTGSAAALMNRELSAQAFTVGQDIYFDAGRYSPESLEGQRLLAHELAHTIQQNSARGSYNAQGQIKGMAHSPEVIQRNQSGSPNAPAITARQIFPFPQGSRVVLNRILLDIWFNMLSSSQPAMGTALQAIERQVATVTIATDDLFEATLANSISLPAQGGNPAVTLNNVTLSLRRQSGGTFDLELSGRADSQASPTTLFAQQDLSARAENGGGIVLSSGAGPTAVPQLRVSPGTSGGQVQIETFTAPYLSQIPAALRGLAPERLDLIRLTRLPDVRAGTAAEQQAVSNIASAVAGQRRQRRQRLTAGGGIQFGAERDPLLTASWQINFTPIRGPGSLLQVPLEVQMQYAPTASILAEVSSGAEVSLSQLNIPVNVRVVAGLAGGTLYGTAPVEGAERPVRPAFGPTLGGAAGVEIGAFRANVRYEHFFNLVSASPNADSVTVQAGLSF